MSTSFWFSWRRNVIVLPNSGKQDGVDFGYFCVKAKQRKRIADSFHITVSYPNLQITEGPGHPDPEMGEAGGGGLTPKIFFRPFGPQFGLKIRRWGRGVVPLDPPLHHLGFTIRGRLFKCKDNFLAGRLRLFFLFLIAFPQNWKYLTEFLPFNALQIPGLTMIFPWPFQVFHDLRSSCHFQKFSKPSVF